MADPNFIKQKMQAKALAQQKKFDQAAQEYSKPPTLDNQVDSMTNSDRLTPFERGVYKVLPGFSQSTIGQALAKFGDSWAGKALNVLDVGAEGVERTLGLLSQLDTGDFDPDDLKAAWYAGGLTYDMMNTPQLKRDKTGKVIGLEIPDDLPDLAGLTKARQQIQDLISQGVDPGEALVKVREGYYTDIGALALRAQMHDAFFHMILDPVNVIAGALKPVEALKIKALTATTQKIGMTAEEITSKADELVRLSKATGDAGEAAEFAKEAERLTQIAADLGTGKLKGITRGDKVAIMLTGGDPYRPSKFAQATAKIPGLNLWQLTPESKSKELLTLVSDNIGVNIIHRVFNSPNAEAEFAQAIERIAKGSTGTEYGHSLITLEGRTVQGFVHASSAQIKKLHEGFETLAEERTFLKTVADTLEMDPSAVLKAAKDNPDLLLRQLANKGSADPTLGALLQQGLLNQEKIATLVKLEGQAYNKEMFFAQALDIIETQAMRQAVVQFGVKSKGTLTRWADAVKSAESLAFLRINPAYPIKNAINNDFTMISRGVFGLMTEETAKDFWRGAGWTPGRLNEAFSAEITGITQHSNAVQVIEDALRGGNYGTPEKVKEFFSKINLGKLDTGSWGQAVERKASLKAMTAGAIQYLRKYWKPKGLSTYLDQATNDLLQNTSPEFAKAFDAAVKSSGARVDKLQEFMNANLHLNTESVLDEAGRILGADAREMMGDEVLEFIHQGLPQAMKDGKVEGFILQTRQKIDGHIQDLFDKQLENVIEHVKAQVVAGGPQTYYKYAGEAQDMFWAAHQEHAFRTPEATRIAREAASTGDFERANILWQRIENDDVRFFDRAFKRVDAYLEGMEKAGAELGTPLPGEVRQSFQQWKKMWAEFFDYRNTERRSFFDAKLKGKEYKKTWDAMIKDFDEKYDLSISKEDELMRAIDDHIASGITDPVKKQAFMASRDLMGELRVKNKQKIIDVMKQVRDLSADQRQPIWNKFWQEQAQSYTEMRDVDAATRAIMQDDPQATQMFSQQVPREPVPEGGVKAPPLTEEQKAAYEAGVPIEDVRAKKDFQADPNAQGVDEANLHDPTEPYYDDAGNLVEPTRAKTVVDVANQYGIPTASPSGRRVNNRLLKIINDYFADNPIGKTEKVASEAAGEMGASGWTKSDVQALFTKSGLKHDVYVDIFGEAKQSKGAALGLFRKKGKSVTGGKSGVYDGGGMDWGAVEEKLKETGLLPEEHAGDKGFMADLIRQGQGTKEEFAAKDITANWDNLEDVPVSAAEQAFQDWAEAHGKAAAAPGQGVVAYHGTKKADMTGFSPKKVGKHELGTGVYFSTSRERAGTFGENVLERNLNVDRPFDITSTKGIGKTRADKINRYLRKNEAPVKKFVAADELDAFKKKLGDSYEIKTKEVPGGYSVTYSKKGLKPDATYAETFAYIQREFPDDSNALIKRMGFDAVKNDTDLMVFDTRQIRTIDQAKAAAEAQAATQASQSFIADLHGIMPDPMPMDLGQDLMSYGRTYGALDTIIDSAKAQAQKTPLFIKDMSPEDQAKIAQAIERVKGDMSSARYTMTRFAEWRRDSALLNYNRRTNFDSFVGNIFPYAFWTTGSIQKWAIESIDRPAMLTNYLRMKKLLETSGLQNEGMPSRVKGNLRINLPFAPEWMGQQFVDPLRFVMPFDALTQPITQFQQAQSSLEGRAGRLLDEQLDQGQITQAEYDQAIQQEGPVWERAVAEAQQNDENQKYDAWDFATAMSSPHAPIMWAYNAAKGHPEDIGPFAPMSRMARNAATLLGVEDWNNSSWNVEAKVRKHLGLPAFDKWDDYRVDRAISDLAGSGDYSLEDVKQATYLSALVQQGKMTPEDAKAQSEAYAEGVKRSNQEYTGGVGGALASLFGLGIKTVPEGETNLRRLQDDFGRAYEARDAANKSLEEFLSANSEMSKDDAMALWQKRNPKLARDANALTEFFDKHPEYEARLGLFDKPEEKIQKFLINQVWARYNDSPDLNKQEMRDQLGPLFQTAFLDKNTRAYDQLSPEQLSVWLKLMGGDPPGTLSATDKALLSLQALHLTKPETAYRVQVFYDTRRGRFADYYDQQKEYFALDKSQRKSYLKQNPGLKGYWDWRREFLTKNPDLAPYLEDDPKRLAEYQKKSRGPGSVPTAQEVKANLPPNVQELLQLYQGEPLPPALEAELQYLALQQGLTLEQMTGIAGYQ